MAGGKTSKGFIPALSSLETFGELGQKDGHEPRSPDTSRNALGCCRLATTQLTSHGVPTADRRMSNKTRRLSACGQHRQFRLQVCSFWIKSTGWRTNRTQVEESSYICGVVGADQTAQCESSIIRWRSLLWWQQWREKLQSLLSHFSALILANYECVHFV